MIASLAMYPLPQVRDATNELWAAIRTNLGRGPDQLGWPDQLEWTVFTPHVWREPNLLLAQCCGWPLVAELPDTVAVVGTFDYAVPDSHDGTYRSRIVTGTDRSLDELRADANTLAAVNDHVSLSGWISLQHAWRGQPKNFVTGAHIESCRALLAARAQVASIDAVTWNLFEEFEPAAVAGLRIIGQGPRVLCLPIFVPAQFKAYVPELRSAIAAAVADPTLAAARAALRIRGFVPRDRSDYLPLLNLLD